MSFSSVVIAGKEISYMPNEGRVPENADAVKGRSRGVVSRLAQGLFCENGLSRKRLTAAFQGHEKRPLAT